jgi:ribose-phosphate pyrophosphokinase
MDKVREGHDESAEMADLIGEVEDRDAIVVDDFTVSCGTLAEAAEELLRRGARSVSAAVTHAVLSPEGVGRLDESPIERLIATDTIETQPTALGSKVEIVSVASLFAEAIRRIDRRESISSLFS